MAEPLTPESTRREEVPSTPIRLADGADWGFARPTDRLFPEVVKSIDPLGRPAERVAVGTEFGYPIEVRRHIDGLKTACEQGPVQDQYEAFFSTAAALLRRSHDVSLAEACDLLSVPQEELPRLVREVMTVISEAERPPIENPVEGSTFE